MVNAAADEIYSCTNNIGIRHTNGVYFGAMYVVVVLILRWLLVDKVGDIYRWLGRSRTLEQNYEYAGATR